MDYTLLNCVISNNLEWPWGSEWLSEIFNDTKQLWLRFLYCLSVCISNTGWGKLNGASLQFCL